MTSRDWYGVGVAPGPRWSVRQPPGTAQPRPVYASTLSRVGLPTTKVMTGVSILGHHWPEEPRHNRGDMSTIDGRVESSTVTELTHTHHGSDPTALRFDPLDHRGMRVSETTVRSAGATARRGRPAR